MEYYLKIAEMKIGNQEDVLKTILGSCIGLCLWDKTLQLGGMVHIMLADSKIGPIKNQGKYATTAVPALLEMMLKKGSVKKNIIAKVFGGASMFHSVFDSANINIGEKNSNKVVSLLNELKIPIIAKDIGGTLGRSITFYCSTGIVKIKTSKGIIQK